MSLRDQLVAKGLVSKKKARQLNREQKEERRQAQASRKKKKHLQREAAAQAAAEAEAKEQQRREARRATQAERDALEQRLQVRNIVLGNRMPLGRAQRFFHRGPDGRTVVASQVSSGLAFKLRCGEAALARLDHPTWVEVVAVPRRAAERLHALAPDQLLFFVEDPTGLSAPDLQFHQRDWEVELGPHRATAEDLARFRG